MTSPISPRRLYFSMGVLGVLLLLVLAQAVRIQIVEAQRFAQQAERQQHVTRYDIAPRGRIFDSYGTPLAISRRAFSVRVDLERRDQIDARALAERLAAATGESPQVLEQRIRAIQASPSPTSTLLAFALTPQEAHHLTATLDARQQTWIVVEPHWWRVYPQGQIAAPLLGFVGFDQDGFLGVEHYYNRELKSRAGLRYERSRTDVAVVSPTIEGADLVLTLDLELQTYAENRLRRALEETNARAGMIAVMEVRSGAILASASAPSFDPNLVFFREGSEGVQDPLVSAVYEPGSVLKVATLAAALDAGVATTATVYNDEGRLVVSDFRVYNANRARYGALTPEDILAVSSNVAVAQVALSLGEERFVAYMQRFGFGSRTGIDLAHELPGALLTPSDPRWRRADLLANSYGQGILVTPIQLLNAYNALANDGLLMQPYVVREWRTETGEVIMKRPTPIAYVVRPETARTIRRLMARALQRGHPDALPPRHTAAGKTGTAEWYKDGKKQDTTIVTFVGFVPAEQPRVTILVRLDEPRSSRWAGPTTTPVFRDVAAYAAHRLGIPPDRP
ncbi:MAG: penicillin-binding protein 2 [Anaerolineae bacterium]|nr:penicillin-binding protein 2 [Anaerolineae bacterium]